MPQRNWRSAVCRGNKQWPEADIVLRQGTRVIHDSREDATSDASGETIDRYAPMAYFNYAASYHAAADLIFDQGIRATQCANHFLVLSSVRTLPKSLSAIERRLCTSAVVVGAQCAKT